MAPSENPSITVEELSEEAFVSNMLGLDIDPDDLEKEIRHAMAKNTAEVAALADTVDSGEDATLEVNEEDATRILEAIVDALDPAKMLPDDKDDPKYVAVNWHRRVSDNGDLRYALLEIGILLDAYVATLFNIASAAVDSDTAAYARELQNCAQEGKVVDVESLQSMVSSLRAKDPSNKFKSHNHFRMEFILNRVMSEKLKAEGLKPVCIIEKYIHVAANMLFRGIDPHKFLPNCLEQLSFFCREKGDEKTEVRALAKKALAYLEEVFHEGIQEA